MTNISEIPFHIHCLFIKFLFFIFKIPVALGASVKGLGVNTYSVALL